MAAPVEQLVPPSDSQGSKLVDSSSSTKKPIVGSRRGSAVAMDKSRTQYITKLPSSALLTHAVAEAFDCFSSFATFKVVEEKTEEFLSAVLSASDQLPKGVSWHLLAAPEEKAHFVLIENIKSSTCASPTSNTSTSGDTPTHQTPPSAVSLSPSTTDAKTPVGRAPSGILNMGREEYVTDLLKSVEPCLESARDVHRFRVCVEAAVYPAALDDTTVELETIQVKPGDESSIIDLARNVFKVCIPANMKGRGAEKSSEAVTIQVQQDLTNSRIFTIVYHFESAEDAQIFHSCEGWGRWRRTLLPLLDGPPRRQKFRGVFHTLRVELGVLTKVSLTQYLPKKLSTTISASSVLPPSVSMKEWEGRKDGTGVVALNPALQTQADYFQQRYQNYVDLKKEMSQCSEGHKAGSLARFSETYRLFGLHYRVEKERGFEYRDWLPHAKEVYLMGDFNEWSRTATPMTREDEKEWGEGVWRVFLPDKQGVPAMKHRSLYKLHIKTKDGQEIDRVSPWARLAWKSDETQLFDGVVWCPSSGEEYKFKHPRPSTPKTPKIYEAHVGISSDKEKVSTYLDVMEVVIPRMKRLGYNTLLLLGVQEHDYYPSFGWHVTSYFAPTSRCGTPEEFKQLVDAAHGMGITVLLSLVHSHASPSALNGIAEVDGPECSYFLEGGAGHHSQWDAKLFDYSNLNVLRFLLSNVRSYIEEYHIDGFRFEGVTSMVYHHHGVGRAWDESAADLSGYITYDLHESAILYLMAANELLHEVLPSAGLSIANEKSSFPTLCLPVAAGGIGFDYRIAPKISADIIQFLLAEGDENFQLEPLIRSLECRRPEEGVVAAAESYDTCLRGRRPMKVALFAWESLLTHCVGGVAPHVTELAAGLSRLGHEVHVFVRTTTEGGSHSVHYGVHYHECAFQLSSDFIGEMVNMCNSFVASMFATENYMHETFAICHAHDWLAAKALTSCAASGHMCIQTIHSTEYGRCGNNNYGGPSKRIRDIEAEACALAQRVICVSGVLAEEVVSQYGVHPDKIRVVYNGIIANQFDGVEDVGAIKQQYGISAMDPMFLFVGRMAVQKGPDLLVEAIPSILSARSDAKFIIVGDGHMLDTLRGRVNQLGVAHACKLIGKLGGAPLKSLFKACDAVVVPSRNEPFGIVVLEAWAASKPVVATTCGGPRDFVSPDVDGYLVDPNPGSISWGCCKILENFDHARWMGSRGRVKAAYSFSWDTIANQTRDLYYEQLAKNDAAYCDASRGDSTLASRLMGGAIFDHMMIFDQNETIDRGLALHKMLRLLVSGLGGEAYLNTMGNEFAQPEFTDLPRKCNNYSSHYARCRWDLADNKQLKFKHFELFDACMNHTEEMCGWLAAAHQFVSLCDETDKVVAFERGENLFIFNFHPHKSYEGYQLGHSLAVRDLRVILDTDEEKFGGFGRIDHSQLFPDLGVPHNERNTSIKLYLPSRTAMVIASDTKMKKMTAPVVLSLSPDEFIDALQGAANHSKA